MTPDAVSQFDSRTANTSEQLKICLFGGTFDPIHLGHTHIAKAAVQQLGIDTIFFLPCKQSPHKSDSSHADDRHRLAMCQLATADFDWAEVDEFDLIAPAPSYSWRTVEAFAKRFPGARIFWLMGTDQWQALPRWNRADYLAGLVEFIVFSRGKAPQARAGYQLHAITGAHPASATGIRDSAASGLKTDWLDPAVSQYIRQHQLYGVS